MADCWTEGRPKGLEAAVVLGQLGNSLLGSQSLKCIVGDDSSVTVSDAVELLKNLDIEHPVGQIIRDACQSHQTTYRTGTKTLLVLIGLWMKSAVRLREQDVPLRDIVQLMHAGIDTILDHLEKMKFREILDHFVENKQEEECRKEWNPSGNIGADTALETGQLPSVFDSSVITDHNTLSAISGSVIETGSDLTFQPSSTCDLHKNKDHSDILMKPKPHLSSLTDWLDLDDDFADCFDGIPKSNEGTVVSEDPCTEDSSQSFSKSRNCDSYLINSSQCVDDTGVKLPTHQTVATLRLQMKKQLDLDECSDDISWYFEPDSEVFQDKSQLGPFSQQMSLIQRNESTSKSSKITKNVPSNELGSDIEINFPYSDIGNLAVQSNSFGEITSRNSVNNRNGVGLSIGETETRKTMEGKQRNLGDLLTSANPVSLPKLKNCSRHFKTIQSTVDLHNVNPASKAENAYHLMENMREKAENAYHLIENVRDRAENAYHLIENEGDKEENDYHLIENEREKFKDRYQNLDGFCSRRMRQSVPYSTTKNCSTQNTELSGLCEKLSCGNFVTSFSVEKTPGSPENGMFGKVNQRKLEALLAQSKPVSLLKLQNSSRHFKTIESTVGAKLGLALTGGRSESYIKERKGDSKETSKLHYNFLDSQHSVEQILDECMGSSSDSCRKSEKAESALKEISTTSKEAVVKNSRSFCHQSKTHLGKSSSDDLSINQRIGQEISEDFANKDRLKPSCDLTDNVKSKPLNPLLLESADKLANCHGDFMQDDQFYRVKMVEELAHRLSHGHDLATSLVLEVYRQHRGLQQPYKDYKMPELDSKRLHTCITGPCSESASCVRAGLVVPMSPDLMIDRSAWRERRTQALLVNGSLSPNSRHTGYKTPVKSLILVRPGSKVSDSWSQKIVKKLLDLDVSVLALKGTVDTDLKLLLESSGVIVVEHIEYRLLTALAGDDVYKLVTYVESCYTEDLCCLNVSTLNLAKDGPKNFLVLKPVDTRKMVWTVVLSHPCVEEAHRREQQVWKCAARLSSVLQGRGVIPGEGQSELQLARWLSAGNVQLPYADDNIFKSLVFEELAAGFREYSSLVLRNAGIYQSTVPKDCPSSLCGHFAKPGEPNVTVNKLEQQGSQFSKDCMNIRSGCHSLDKSSAERNDHFLDNSLSQATHSPGNSVPLLCPNCEALQRSSLNHNRPYLDDFDSKAAAYRAALETVCLILQCDYHISTGVSDHHGTKVKNVL